MDGDDLIKREWQRARKNRADNLAKLPKMLEHYEKGDTAHLNDDFALFVGQLVEIIVFETGMSLGKECEEYDTDAAKKGMVNYIMKLNDILIDGFEKGHESRYTPGHPHYPSTFGDRNNYRLIIEELIEGKL